MNKKVYEMRSDPKLRSMITVDFRRVFTMPLFYIMLGVSFVIPILVLVMTSSMAGTVTVDPNTGVETTLEAFDSVWQVIGTNSGASGGMDMSITGMVNINLIFFLSAIFVNLFVADDFRSGYVKNLFTVRAIKRDYVISKTLIGILGGGAMLLSFFLGAVLGGKISGLSFAVGITGAFGILMCMLGKILLMGIFSGIYVLMSVIAKQRLWLSVLLSLMCGMFLFNIVPMVTPLDSTPMNVLLCGVGGLLFSIGLGAVSNQALLRQDLI